jgi:hypothetical protein
MVKGNGIEETARTGRQRMKTGAHRGAREDESSQRQGLKNEELKTNRQTPRDEPREKSKSQRDYESVYDRE